MKPLTNEAVAKKKDTAMAIVKALAKSKHTFIEPPTKKGCSCGECQIYWLGERAHRFLKQAGGKGK